MCVCKREGERDEKKKSTIEKCRERKGEWIGYDKTSFRIQNRTKKLLNLSKYLYQQGKHIIEFLCINQKGGKKTRWSFSLKGIT